MFLLKVLADLLFCSEGDCEVGGGVCGVVGCEVGGKECGVVGGEAGGKVSGEVGGEPLDDILSTDNGWSALVRYPKV